MSNIYLLHQGSLHTGPQQSRQWTETLPMTRHLFITADHNGAVPNKTNLTRDNIHYLYIIYSYVSSTSAGQVVRFVLQQANRHAALQQDRTALVCVMAAVQMSGHSWTTTTPSVCQSWPLLCSLRSKRGSKGQAKIRRWLASQHLDHVVPPLL